MRHFDRRNRPSSVFDEEPADLSTVTESSVTVAPSIRSAFSSSPVEEYDVDEYVPPSVIVVADVPCVTVSEPPNPPGILLLGGCIPP